MRSTTPDVLGDPVPADDPSLVAILPTLTGNLIDVHVMPLDQIKVTKRLRNVNMDKVREVAESISRIGLLEPLVVREDGTLIAGRHRLEALRFLGWLFAPVRVMVLSDLDAELAEIDENLIRSELNLLERGEHLARRKQIYETLHPETRHGALGGGRNGVGVRSTENDIVSFSVDTAAKIGVSPRTLQREVKIGQSIASDVREMILRPDMLTADTPLNRRHAERTILHGNTDSVARRTKRPGAGHPRGSYRALRRPANGA